jgi:hypothetical protein
MHGSERWSGNCAVRNLGLDRMTSKMWLGNQLRDARLDLPQKPFERVNKEYIHGRTSGSFINLIAHDTLASQFDTNVLSVSLATNVFIFIVTSSEIRSIQATRNNPQSTMSRNLA